jgi:hypothetical protein
MASTGSCSRVAQRQLSRSASARCAVRASRIRFTRHTRWVRNTGGGFVAYTRSLLRMFFMIVPSLSGQTTTIAVHKQAESKRLLLHCCSFLIQSSSAGAVRDRLQVLSRLQRRESDALRPRSGCEIRIFCAKFMLKMVVLPRQARDKHRESTQKRKYNGLFAGIFLAVRGNYSWLGYAWMGCGCGWEHNGKMPCDIYQRPAALDVDYGVPTELCKETSTVRLIKPSTASPCCPIKPSTDGQRAARETLLGVARKR